MRTALPHLNETNLEIPIHGVTLVGDLIIPEEATGLVVFAHGSGSSRKSSRNRFVAGLLHQHRLGTLLFDLLTLGEEREDEITAAYRFNIALLSDRLIAVTGWLFEQFNDIQTGYFGASTGAAAALNAAAYYGRKIGAVVSRGGRPDLASNLPEVLSPTLLIVGSLDHVVIQLNQTAFDQLTCPKQFELVPGATHLFQEPGTLQQAGNLAANWFSNHLK